MKKAFVLLLSLTVFIIFSSATLAAAEPASILPSVFAQESNPEEIPETVSPLIETLAPLIRKLSVIVGGLFGLYIILILVRIYYEYRVLKTLRHIRYDLDQLNTHYGLPTSRDKKGIIRKTFNFIFRRKNKNTKK